MLVLLAAVALLVGTTDACSCMPAGSLQRQICSATNLIKAHIIEEIDTGVNYDNWNNQDIPRQFKVNVLSVFKGEEFKTGELTLYTASNGAMCGVYLPSDSIMLLDVYTYQGKVQIGLCNTIQMWDSLTDDMAMKLENNDVNCDCQPITKFGRSRCCTKYNEIFSVEMCYVWYGNCEASNDKDMCMWEKNESLDECLANAGFFLGEDGCADRIPCPKGSTFNSNSYSAQATCNNRETTKDHYSTGRCECERGMLLDEDSNMCVKEGDCPQVMDMEMFGAFTKEEAAPECDGQQKLDKMIADTVDNKKFKPEYLTDADCPANQVWYGKDKCLPCVETCMNNLKFCPSTCVSGGCGCPEDKPVMGVVECFSRDECPKQVEEAEEEYEEEQEAQCAKYLMLMDAFPPPGAFTPNCNMEGNYEYEQCHGSVCYCVDEMSGEEVAGSSHSRGERFDCESFVMKECEGGMEWSDCGSACTRTCDDKSPFCTKQCVPKCECPRDMPYWDAEMMKCISGDMCEEEATPSDDSVTSDGITTESNYYTEKSSPKSEASTEESVSTEAAASTPGNEVTTAQEPSEETTSESNESTASEASTESNVSEETTVVSGGTEESTDGTDAPENTDGSDEYSPEFTTEGEEATADAGEFTSEPEETTSESGESTASPASTEAEAISTEAEAISTEAEAISTEADAISTEAEAISTEAGTVSTEAVPTKDSTSEPADTTQKTTSITTGASSTAAPDNVSDNTAAPEKPSTEGAEPTTEAPEEPTEQEKEYTGESTDSDPSTEGPTVQYNYTVTEKEPKEPTTLSTQPWVSEQTEPVSATTEGPEEKSSPGEEVSTEGTFASTGPSDASAGPEEPTDDSEESTAYTGDSDEDSTEFTGDSDEDTEEDSTEFTGDSDEVVEGTPLASELPSTGPSDASDGPEEPTDDSEDSTEFTGDSDEDTEEDSTEFTGDSDEDTQESDESTASEGTFATTVATESSDTEEDSTEYTGDSDEDTEEDSTEFTGDSDEDTEESRATDESEEGSDDEPTRPDEDTQESEESTEEDTTEGTFASTVATESSKTEESTAIVDQDGTPTTEETIVSSTPADSGPDNLEIQRLATTVPVEETEEPTVDLSSMTSCQKEAYRIEQAAKPKAGVMGGMGMLGAHGPECAPDGSYNPKQCKEAECFCVNEQGESIEGASWYRYNQWNLDFECDYTGVVCPDSALSFYKCAPCEKQCFLFEPACSEECKPGCGCPMDAQFLQDGECVAEADCIKPDPYHEQLQEMLPAKEDKAEPEKPALPCIDKNKNCPVWAKRNLCTNPYLEQNCHLSCDNCPKVEEAAPKEATCASVRDTLQGMQKEGMGGVAQVQCNDDGTWFPRQCLGSVCYCVDAMGKEEERSAHHIATMYPCSRWPECPSNLVYDLCNPAKKATCDNMADLVVDEGCFDSCRCPDDMPIYSEEMEKCVAASECPKKQLIEVGVDCSAAYEAAEKSAVDAFGNMMFGVFMPNCKTDLFGMNSEKYDGQQCHGSVCFCVTEEGAEIPESEHNRGTNACVSATPECEGGQEWMECGSACDKNCLSITEVQACTLQCVPKCQCPGSSVMGPGGECIQPSECPDVLEAMPANCRDRVAFMNRLEMNLLQGAPYPECNSDGNYAYTQCSGSVCFCVEPESGDQIPDSEHNIGQDFDCEIFVLSLDCVGGMKYNTCGSACQKTCDNRMPACTRQCVPQCECPRDMPYWDAESESCIAELECPETLVRGFISTSKTCTDTVNAAMDQMVPGVNVPKCEDDGTYYPQQCIGSLCFCVSSTGEEVMDSEHRRGGDYVCPALAERCTGGAEWSECGSNCNKTCDELAPKCNLMVSQDGVFSSVNFESSECVPRCQCPTGKLQWDGQCIDASECPYLNVESLPTKCAYRSIELGLLNLPPGANEIVCDDDGDYADVQCTGSVCNCVNKKDGKKIENTEHARGETVDCSRERSECEMKEYAGESVSCSKDGSYQPKQCSDDECWCSNPMGGEFSGSRHAAGANGKCFAKRDEWLMKECVEKMMKCKVEDCDDMVLACDNDGDYEPVQCTDNGQCYCVLSDGMKIEGTDFNVLEDGAQNERCMSLQMTLSDSACLRDEGARCDMESGAYLSYQCNDKMCHCVDEDGMMLMDSEQTGWEDREDEADDVCDAFREMIASSACYAEKKAAKDKMGAFSPNCNSEDGSYKARQCMGSVCDCVDSEGNKLAMTEHAVADAAEYDCDAKRELHANSECINDEGARCDMESGAYLSYQCNDKMCHCVDEEGMMLMDSEQTGWEDREDEADDVCDAFREMIASSACYTEKMAAKDKMGAFSPNCNSEDGSYKARQCKGSVCDCVDNEGNKLMYTEHAVADASEYDCDMKRELYANSECIKQVDEISDSGMIGVVVICDYETGNYAAQQCSGSECYCASEGGEKIEGSNFHVAMSSTKPCGDDNDRFISCADKREMIMNDDSYMKGGKVPMCETNGMYYAQQCEGSSCSCVDKFGKAEEGDTSHHISENACMKKDETKLMSSTPPSCETVAAAAEERLGAYTPICNDDGSFQAKQYFGAVAFCVGEDGRKIGDEFDISADVRCKVLTCAEKYDEDREEYGDDAEVVQCDTDGGFMPEQCGEPYRSPDDECFCVNKQGETMEGTGHNRTDTFFCYKTAEAGDCESVKSRLDEMMVPGGLYVVCDEDGDFGRQQCSGSVCNCYTDEGVMVSGSEHSIGNNPCEESATIPTDDEPKGQYIYNSKRGYITCQDDSKVIVSNTKRSDDSQKFIFSHHGFLVSKMYPGRVLTQQIVSGGITLILKENKKSKMQTWAVDQDKSGADRLYVSRKTKKGDKNSYLDYYKQSLTGYTATNKVNQRWTLTDE